jgi:uncharacterized protein (TIGR02147 family)
MNSAVQTLKNRWSERQLSNPAYSLRAFARDLGLNPSQLSLVLNGKRGLSPPVAAQVAQKLELSSSEQDSFIAAFRAEFAASPIQRTLAQAQLEHSQTFLVERSLEVDLFKTVSSWHHFGLLELIKISGKRSGKGLVQWLSNKLGIPENETLLALARLERLELIRKEESKYVVNQESIFADHPTPTEAMRKFHRQILEKATAALTYQSAEERYGISDVMPTRVKNVVRAKKLIQKFRQDFAKEISEPEGGDEIYGLSLQFFRLSQKENS